MSNHGSLKPSGAGKGGKNHEGHDGFPERAAHGSKPSVVEDFARHGSKQLSVFLEPCGNRLDKFTGFAADILLPKGDNLLVVLVATQDDRDAASREGGWEASLSGEGFGTEDEAVPVFFLRILGVVASRQSTGFQETEDRLAARGLKDGVPVIEQKRGLVVGQSSCQASGGNASGLPGLVAEYFEQIQTTGFAGLTLGRGYLEVGGDREMLIAISMGDPESEDPTLMPGADEVAGDEGLDAVVGLDEGGRSLISVFIRSHGAIMRTARLSCQAPK